MSEKDIFSGLNEKQIDAVKTIDGYLRVIAGAGSGKTKLLVSRYAYLVKELGIDSANILCITFTSKAALEMKKRARALLGDAYGHALFCTYHGFCVTVLREDIEKVFYPKGFTILSPVEQKGIIKEIYQKYEIKYDKGSYQKILKYIGTYKRKNEYVHKMCNRDNIQFLSEIHTLEDKILEDYLQKQKNIFGLDFDDLLYFTLYIFRNYKDVLQKWQNRLNYIQVDEFQDSSKIEMELIDNLASHHNNVMIVGDPDQNIYEWRGSDVKLLVNFNETHKPCETKILNQNYRSTKAILNVANVLIDKNTLRLKKDLFTNNSDDTPVIHFHTKNENEEAEKIILKINELIKEHNVKYNEIAILYRSSYLSRIIEKKLVENAIPYEIFGGQKFFQREEIKNILAYLQLIAYDDDLALKRIINQPQRKFGRNKFKKLKEMQVNGKSLFSTLINNTHNICPNNNDINKFIENINRIKNQYKTKRISEIVEDVCHSTGYETYIRELGDEDRFENLSEFKRIANEYETNFGENISLENFIDQLILQSDSDLEKESDQVKLMTIHAAKGLEFDNVFVVGLSEGIFPSPRTIEDRKKEGIEEERRLCYVALTRAKKRLFMTDSEGFTQNDKQKLPSRFLFEMGEENYTRIGIIPEDLTNNVKKVMNDNFSCINSSNMKVVGDEVEHKIFGKGKIVSINNERRTYQIQFENLKTLRDISIDFFNIKTNEGKDCQNNLFKKKDYNELLDFEDDEIDENEKEDIDSNDENEEIDNNDIDDSDNDNQHIKAVQNNNKTIDWDDFPEIEKKNADREKPNLKNYDCLWDNPNVPKTGWTCIGVIDLGGPYGVCEMCAKQIIRYVHNMQHPNYRTLGVGCVCAGKMEGNEEGAKQREQEFKYNQNKMISFIKKQWKESKKGNRFLKYNGHTLVMFYDYQKNKFKYSIDGNIAMELFNTAREVKYAIFEKLFMNR